MGEHTPAETVEIKVKDEEIIKLDQLEDQSPSYTRSYV